MTKNEIPTTGQIEALRELFATPRISHTELAKRLKVSRQAAALRVDGCQRHGWVRDGLVTAAGKMWLRTVR